MLDYNLILYRENHSKSQQFTQYMDMKNFNRNSKIKLRKLLSSVAILKLYVPSYMVDISIVLLFLFSFLFFDFSIFQYEPSDS